MERRQASKMSVHEERAGWDNEGQAASSRWLSLNQSVRKSAELLDFPSRPQAIIDFALPGSRVRVTFRTGPLLLTTGTFF